MNGMIRRLSVVFAGAMISFLVGCSGALVGSRNPYAIPQSEAQWIRDGEPIVFENEAWYPKDDVDVLTNQEVYLLGEYEGVQFFVEKADVRPYNRLYTKFGENRFRVFVKQRHD